MRILIVDDSMVYRTQIRQALSYLPGVEVVGMAGNGKLALQMIAELSVDLITLDMEMPIMDGRETLRELRKINREVKVIVFSSLTQRGSEATVEALTNGADDFVTKPILSGGDGVAPDVVIGEQLLPKIRQFMPRRREREDSNRVPVKEVRTPEKNLQSFLPDALVIASSTGGPAAHEEIFRGFGGKLRCPVFIAQHMPPIFTEAFAKRIAAYSGLPCKEAVHGEAVTPQIYIAPGDFHLTLRRELSGQIVTALDKAPQRNSVRPAADSLFETAAQIYGSKCMAVVLTGMGEDGLVGARAVRGAGGGILIQNAESCVVFGMPGALWSANLYDEVGSLSDIRGMLKRMIQV